MSGKIWHLDLLNACASGINNYFQYDLSKKIKQSINIKKLNLCTLQDDFVTLGNYLLAEYERIIPSQIAIDEYVNEITNGLQKRTCCKKLLQDFSKHFDMLQSEMLQPFWAIFKCCKKTMLRTFSKFWIVAKLIW